MNELTHTLTRPSHERLERALALGRHYLDLQLPEKALEWVEPHLHGPGNSRDLDPLEQDLLACALTARRLRQKN